MERPAVRTVLAGLLLAGLASLVVVGPAYGHAQLLSSSPGAGTTLDEAPSELVLVFSEPLDPSFIAVQVTDEAGEEAGAGAPVVDPDDAHRLSAALPALGERIYTVAWQVLSAADGHVTQGSFQFGIGDVDPAGASSGSTPGDLHVGESPLTAVADVVSRSLNYLGLFVATGLLLVVATVVRPAIGRWPRSVATLGAAALALAALGTMGSIGLGIASVAVAGQGDPLAYVTSSRSGTLLTVRAAVAGLGVVAVLLLRNRRPEAALAVAAACGLAGILLTAFLSHGAAFGAIGPVVAVGTHLVAAGVWATGILCLVLLGLGRLGPGHANWRVAVPRFSALALVAVGFVVATGVYATWLQVGSIPGLQTPYGTVLVAKIALAAVAVGLGAVNLFDGGRNLGLLGGLRRRVGAEVAVAGVIVILTANLVGGAPPRGEVLVAIPRVAGNEGVELAFIDLPPGPNRAHVTLPPPGHHAGTLNLAMERVDATGSAIVALGSDPNGRHGFQFIGEVVLPADSSWSATVVGDDEEGLEVWRTRFGFELSASGLVVERALAVDIGLLVGLAMLAVALGGLGYWLGGGTLPRTEPVLGRRALGSGAVIGVVVAGCLLVWAPPV